MQEPSPVSFEELCFRLLTAGFGALSHTESVKGQVGWRFGKPDLVKDLVAQGRGVVSSCPLVAAYMNFPSQFNIEYCGKIFSVMVSWPFL